MSTTSRKDFDAELAAWLELIRDSHAPEAQRNELYRANDAAKAVKDKRPPIGDAVHARVDAALTAMGL
jgi:hypothetical protein